ncbi:MAG TPA: DUF4129 domain-containing protein [Pyrinomonadaceae bacterium]|jgi:hypothetical protein
MKFFFLDMHLLCQHRRHVTVAVARFVVAALLVVACATASPTAAEEASNVSTLAAYRERVHKATLALDALAAPDEDTSVEQQTETATGVIRQVRSMLPPRERVEWNGASLDVNNSWLHAALDTYERTNATAVGSRRASLARTTERLRALDERLAAMDAATAANSPARDKRADKERLEAILRRPEFAPAQPKNKSALSRFFDQLRDWLDKLIPEQKQIQPGASPRLSTGAQIFIYLLALAILVFVIGKYARPFFSRGGLRSVKVRRESRVVLGVRLEADQTPADLLADAEQLARRGDVRGAIRKAYVALLCELGERKILRLAQHKTNRDYLHTLRHEQASLYSEVQPLTMNFERHWYGYEDATDADWTDFRTRCRQVLAKG